jgi:hypothetical protein
MRRPCGPRKRASRKLDAGCSLRTRSASDVARNPRCRSSPVSGSESRTGADASVSSAAAVTRSPVGRHAAGAFAVREVEVLGVRAERVRAVAAPRHGISSPAATSTTPPSRFHAAAAAARRRSRKASVIPTTRVRRLPCADSIGTAAPRFGTSRRGCARRRVRSFRCEFLARACGRRDRPASSPRGPGSSPRSSRLERLSTPRRSHIKVYPDTGHGFLNDHDPGGATGSGSRRSRSSPRQLSRAVGP